MCPLIQCLKKCIQQRKYKKTPDASNPFRDVQMVHQDSEGSTYIHVSVAASEHLEPSAIKKTIADLLALEMLRLNCVSITETTNSSSNDVLYSGRVVVKKQEVCVN